MGIPIDHLKKDPPRDFISYANSATGSVTGRFNRELGNRGPLWPYFSIPTMGDFVWPSPTGR